MDLQTIFYLVAIVFMSLGIAFLIVAIVLLLFVKSKVGQVSSLITEKINMVSSVAEYTGGVAGVVGSKVVEAVVGKAQSMMNEKKRKKTSE